MSEKFKKGVKSSNPGDLSDFEKKKLKSKFRQKKEFIKNQDLDWIEETPEFFKNWVKTWRK